MVMMAELAQAWVKMEVEATVWTIVAMEMRVEFRLKTWVMEGMSDCGERLGSGDG